MDFSLKKREGVPDRLMAEFYERGREAGDFGVTKGRSESELYDTLVLAVDREVVGTANLICYDGEASLEGCYILPDYRGDLREYGKSAFEHMAGLRLKRTSLPAKTDATTEHGKTQHIYDKLDLSPYKFKLPSSENKKSYVIMGDINDSRRFDYGVYVPEPIKDFVDYVSQSFNQRANFRKKENRETGIKFIDEGSDEGYDLFSITEDGETDDDLDQILEAKQDAVSVRVDIDASNPSSYRAISRLLEEDFTATAFEPVIEGSKNSQNPVVQLGYNEPVDAELIPRTREFLEEAGWDLKIVDRKDNSDKVKIKPSSD